MLESHRLLHDIVQRGERFLGTSKKLWIAPIVEGHGECACIRTLIDRIWRELLQGDHVEVIRPIRQGRYSLVNKKESLEAAICLASLKLRERLTIGTKYSETQDQPRMTAQMDLALCRRRCPSFDKLCRELASRVEMR